MSDTIFALSSGQGKAGVAVIRISGPQADQMLLALAGRLPPPRLASLLSLKNPEDGQLIDKALVLRFAHGSSFTGEASVELHVHGGRAVVQSLLRLLESMPGLRLAEPGEYTRRALENGRLDLTQVEALADLIDADTELQRRQALRGFEGHLGREVSGWRDQLLEIKALIAADIDFSDEGDIGEEAAVNIDSYLERLETALTEALRSFQNGRIVSEGFRVVLIGAPNVGKSTLLNALAGSDVAIVTEHAGTTRDILDIRLDLSGYQVIISDSAGIRDTADPVESIGISRTKFMAARADLLLLLDDGSETSLHITDELPHVPSIRVRTKSDLSSTLQSQGSIHSHYEHHDLVISARTGAGLPALRELITAQVTLAAGHGVALITRTRQEAAVKKALLHCQSARSIRSHGIEFVDNEVSLIDLALQELLGTTGVEDVLGQVFSRFCVGK